MKRNIGTKKNNLQALVEYRLEYREERKRMDRQFKTEIEKSLSFMGM